MTRSLAGPVIGGVIGAAFVLFIGGLRVFDPTEYAWLMKLDWRLYFLTWQIFRGEPWQWPPGRLDGYFHAPDGTSIGITDAVPLVALPLKAVSPLLPQPFQYIGLWLILCFALQGVFGALLARLWTPRLPLQVLAALLFVLMPTLLIRVGHPALCSHFLLLWPLWLYWRGPIDSSSALRQHLALGACAGLIQPYLAMMTLAVLAAIVLRDRSRAAAAAFAVACLAVVAGWWISGMFILSGVDSLVEHGLTIYSMNILGPITPSGWSTLLPALPAATEGQPYEGFQYFGAGLLVLLAAAALLAIRHRRILPPGSLAPILAVCAASALYALSPRVTFGSAVLVDFTTPALERLAAFRATGRFFWPLAYLLVALAIGRVVATLRFRAAAAVLALAAVLQLVDLRQAHAERRATSRSDAFHTWPNPLVSPAWHQILPYYRHLVIVPPQQCGPAPTPFEPPAFLAGLHHLTINAGDVSRVDRAKRRKYCERLEAEILTGTVDDESLYILDGAHAATLKAAARKPVVCGSLDALLLCATARSYEPWKNVLALQ